MKASEIKSGEDMARQLGHFVNAMGHDIEGFVEYLTKVEHRTLQQRVMALFLGFVEAQAGKTEFQFDLRNEDTVKICRAIKEALAEKSFGLPLHKMVRFI
jgi:hypothetical protein